MVHAENDKDFSTKKPWWQKVTLVKRLSVSKRSNTEVFGVPLHLSLLVARSNIAFVDNNDHVHYGMIPLLVSKVGTFLKDKGTTTKGLFRISGSAKRINELVHIFNTSPDYGKQLNWQGYTVHDAATLLRRYLNHLPEPVITHSFYQSFRDVIELNDNEDKKIKLYQELINQLPKYNQYLLFYILDLLSFFTKQQQLTKMDSFGLACIFTPGLLINPDHALNPLQYKVSQKVIEFLIQHQSQFILYVNKEPAFISNIHKKIENENDNISLKSSATFSPPSPITTTSTTHIDRLSHKQHPFNYSTSSSSSPSSPVTSINDHQMDHGKYLNRSKTFTVRSKFYGSHDPIQIIRVTLQKHSIPSPSPPLLRS
ncbi:Rho GTPase activation protein [Cunninghamella echinulata]|nr:Rho GTPase activation protein [Cunninghamella echinulata]